MIKTKSYYKYLLNLNLKYLSKKYLFCFFFNLINLSMPLRNTLLKWLILEKVNYLIVKNLVSMDKIIFPSCGEYLIIFSNKIIFENNLIEQFKLNCCSLLFKGYYVNNLYVNNLNNINLYYMNNFILFIGYLMYCIYVYVQYLSFLRFQIAISIRKLQFNLCKQ